MKRGYYDVICVGMELSSLLAGALLSRRGFRVLVVGQGTPSASYRLGGFELPTESWAFTGMQSPAVQRTLSELSLTPLVRRRSLAARPPQLVLPGHRFSLLADAERRRREMRREFAMVARSIDDFHRELARVMELFDLELERGRHWPPRGVLERRSLHRTALAQRFGADGDAFDPFAALADDHPFRAAVDASAAAVAQLVPESLPALAKLRLYGHWLAGPTTLEGGLPWLMQALAERVRGSGGDVRPKENVSRVITRRGRVRAVEMAGSGDVLGTSFVIAGTPVSEFADKLDDRTRLLRIFERRGEPRARSLRYTLNLVVRAEGVPVGMDGHTLFVTDPGEPPSGENLLHLVTSVPDDSDRRVITVTAHLSRRSVEEEDGYLQTARERLLARLDPVLPFLDRHLLRVDSPHDGRPMEDRETGAFIESEEPWLRGPHILTAIYDFPVRSSLGLAAVPIRTPVSRLLLAGREALPALGLEGAVLTARAAAHVVRRADRKKEWMRRGLWTKVEL